MVPCRLARHLLEPEVLEIALALVQVVLELPSEVVLHPLGECAARLETRIPALLQVHPEGLQRFVDPGASAELPEVCALLIRKRLPAVGQDVEVLAPPARRRKPSTIFLGDLVLLPADENPNRDLDQGVAGQPEAASPGPQRQDSLEHRMCAPG